MLNQWTKKLTFSVANAAIFFVYLNTVARIVVSSKAHGPDIFYSVSYQFSQRKSASEIR
jgi:hypothetical protein